jgi:C_GCAxxG_C_C family probable redox protein
MSQIQEAVRYFENGCACSQAVFAAYAKSLSIDELTALKISLGFAAGMRKGEVCGAVTGAIMALGLKYGNNHCDKMAERQKVYELVNRLHARFIEKHGSIRCNDLLGVDMGTPEGRKASEAQDFHHTKCPAFVRSAAEILEEIFDSPTPL